MTGVLAILGSQEYSMKNPSGSKYPNMKSIPKATIAIPNAEDINSLYLGTLDP